MSSTSVLVALCSAPDSMVASDLARRLVEAGLVACVNLVPSVTSVYRWQGKTQEDSECLMVIKLTDHGVEPLKQFINANHPYEVPELIFLRATDGLASYLSWVKMNSVQGILGS